MHLKKWMREYFLHFVSLLLASSFYNCPILHRMEIVSCEKKVNGVHFAAVNEDSRQLRMLTDMLLELYPGGVIYEFSNPTDVLACIRTHRLNAVFLELAEANAQGMHLLSQIRKLDVHVPVIISAEDDGLLEEAMWNGASCYFVKPVMPEQLLAAVEQER